MVRKTNWFLAGAIALLGIISMLFLMSCPDKTDPQPKKYSVNKGTHENGDFSISPEKAASGATVILTPKPNDGYMFVKWNLTPDSLSAEDNNDWTWSFTMPSMAVTVDATFAAIPADTFLIFKGTHENGNFITNRTSALADQTVTLTPQPKDGYIFGSWSFSPDSIIATEGSDGEWSFSMPAANVTVSANFILDTAPKFAINKETPANGSFTASLTEAPAGATITLTPTGNTGYEFDTWTCTPATVVPAPGTNGKWTFTMPDSAVTVNATFKLIIYTIIKGNTLGGDILDENPAIIDEEDHPDVNFTIDSETASMGATITLTPTTDEEYGFGSWSCTPASVVPTAAEEGKWTFTMPAGDVTVNAKFIKKYTVTTGTISGGGDFVISPEGFFLPGTKITLSLTSDTPSNLTVNLWNNSPATTIPAETASGSRTWTFDLPHVNTFIGAEFGTDTGPAGIIIEDWNFPAGAWEERYEEEDDTYYWKYPRTEEHISTYGEFKDSNGVERIGTQFIAPDTSNNNIGARYTRDVLTGDRVLDLTGFTEISLWVMADTTTQSIKFQFDNPPGELRHFFEFSVTEANVWEEVIIPLTEIKNSDGGVVKPEEIEGYSLNTTDGTSWFSTITAIR